MSIARTNQSEIREEKHHAPIDYKSIHPNAKAEDFYANGKLLPDDQINNIKAALVNEQGDFRYSKRYLQEVLGVNISRGGILRIKNKDTNRYELHAIYKTSVDDQKALVLGAGCFGKVKVLQNLETGAFDLVIKVVHCGRQITFSDIKNEAVYLNKLKRGGQLLKKKVVQGALSHNSIGLIQKRILGKELVTMIKGLTVAECYDVMLQAMQCIKHLHNQGLLHRDIKPENFLYDGKTVNVIDFGFMREIYKPFDYILGTRGFIAPEIRQNENYSTASDVFALGVCFEEVFKIIKVATHPFGLLDVNDWVGFSRSERVALSKLADQMIEDDPVKRISLDQALIRLQEIRAKYSRTISPVIQEEKSDLKSFFLSHEVKMQLKFNTINSIDKSVSITEIVSYLNNYNENKKTTESDAKQTKQLCTAYAYQAIQLFKANVTDQMTLCHILGSLANITESLPHYGFFSSKTKALSPTAKMLRVCANEFFARFSQHDQIQLILNELTNLIACTRNLSEADRERMFSMSQYLSKLQVYRPKVRSDFLEVFQMSQQLIKSVGLSPNIKRSMQHIHNRVCLIEKRLPGSDMDGPIYPAHRF